MRWDVVARVECKFLEFWDVGREIADVGFDQGLLYPYVPRISSPNMSRCLDAEYFEILGWVTPDSVICKSLSISSIFMVRLVDSDS